MTLKNNKKASIEGDKYYTPLWCVQQCIDYVLPLMSDEPFKTILEPGAGLGAFLKPLRAAYPNALIHANDIDQTVGPWSDVSESFFLDYLNVGMPPLDGGKRYDLVVGNPPFTFAMEFISKSLELSEAVVFILRQGFMSSAERSRFFREHKPSVVRIISARPSFTPDGETDSADYCWIGWKRGFTGKTDLDWLPELPKEVRLAPYFPPDVVAAAKRAKVLRDAERKLKKRAELKAQEEAQDAVVASAQEAGVEIT